jgi:DNA-binding transcriptional MerR regulator
MHSGQMKIGDVARRTGVSARTLRFYEERGLLSPSERSDAGYRLYEDDDLRRLMRIVALRQLGLGLDEVVAVLDDPAIDPRATLRAHLARLEQQSAEIELLRTRVSRALEHFDATGSAPTETVIDAIEVMMEMHSHFTKDELARLRELHRNTTPEHIDQVQREWPELIASVERERAAGSDPADPAVQALAGRWRELVQAFTKDDPQIAERMREAYAHNPRAASRGMVSPELLEYVGRAIRCLDDR